MPFLSVGQSEACFVRRRMPAMESAQLISTSTLAHDLTIDAIASFCSVQSYVVAKPSAFFDPRLWQTILPVPTVVAVEVAVVVRLDVAVVVSDTVPVDDTEDDWVRDKEEVWVEVLVDVRDVVGVADSVDVKLEVWVDVCVVTWQSIKVPAKWPSSASLSTAMVEAQFLLQRRLLPKQSIEAAVPRGPVNSLYSSFRASAARGQSLLSFSKTLLPNSLKPSSKTFPVHTLSIWLMPSACLL